MRPEYDLSMDFHMTLHEQLASLDDLAVAGFVHEDEFLMETNHHRVQVGAVLVGTHHGNW